jgi:MoxR-like ATPase
MANRGERRDVRVAGMMLCTNDVFVGRGEELAALDQVHKAGRAGSGATVLVCGEAGIGKTRLMREVASRAQETGFEVLVGRSIDLVGTELMR